MVKIISTVSSPLIMFKHVNQRSVSLNDIAGPIWFSWLREEWEIQMENAETGSDFISLKFKLCSEAIVSCININIWRRERTTQNKFKPRNLKTTLPFVSPPLECWVQISVIRIVYQTHVEQCLSTQHVYTSLQVHCKAYSVNHYFKILQLILCNHMLEFLQLG